MSKKVMVFGCAALMAASMLVFSSSTAEAHPPFGFRVARGTARVAARAAAAPVRAASRVTYRAATTPIYRGYPYPSRVRHSYYAPRSIGYAPRYRVSPVFASPSYYRPSVGVYFRY